MLDHLPVSYAEGQIIINTMIIKSYPYEKAGVVKDAWVNSEATGVAFGGLTYEQFCSGVAPSHDTRVDYSQTLNVAVGQRQAIDNADEDTGDLVQRVVDGIKSHPDYGINSPFYAQCGYVPKNQRRSGNTRGPGEPEPPISGSLN